LLKILPPVALPTNTVLPSFEIDVPTITPVPVAFAANGRTGPGPPFSVVVTTVSIVSESVNSIGFRFDSASVLWNDSVYGPPLGPVIDRLPPASAGIVFR
jgi:hypothetical protein